MNKETPIATRTVWYDEELNIEAYRLNRTVQPFPNHFHQYYVIGFMERGNRRVSYMNKDYSAHEGDIILFNPRDSHACAQLGDEPLIYCGLNIKEERMVHITREITGSEKLIRFEGPIVYDEEAACYLRPLHDMIITGSREFAKEENLLLLISLLIQRYSRPAGEYDDEEGTDVEQACRFIEENYRRHMSLDDICRSAGLSKSALLRAFTRHKGVTPYRYLQAVRIGEAKKLLEKGASAAETALQTGFTDQSHFTNCFNTFMGLTPGMYKNIFTGQTERRKEDGLAK